MSIEAETNVNSTVVEVEVTTAPMAVVSVGGSTAAPVSSAPLGDAVVEGPQSVTVVSGPPGPPGPIGSGELEMRVDGAYTLIRQETVMRAAADEALASRHTTFETQLGEFRSSLTELETTYSGIDGAFALLKSEVEAARDGEVSLLARITEVNEARVSGDQALATSISEQTVIVGNHTTAIGTLTQSYADLNTAYGLVQTEIEAARSGSGNLLARLTTLDQARVDGDTALATRATNLEAEVHGARGGSANLNARLGVIDTARVDGEAALSSRATALEAEISGAKAGQASLLARLTQIDQARVDGDTALSSTITTVEAKANSATAGGAVRLVAAAAPSGVSALYEWEIVAGAKKTGMRAGVMSSGAQPGFIEFETEAFRIRNSSGVPTPVFEVTGGQVYINGARLPMVDDLPPPFAGFSRMPYHIAFDDRGRITDADPAFRLRSFDLANGKGVGAVPYVANTADAPGGGFQLELWDFVVSSPTGRALLAAGNAAAARTTIGAQAANARLTAIAGATTMAMGAVPYIFDIATPPGGGAAVEIWESVTSSSLGRSLLAASDAAAARTLIGAAATGGGPHTHVIADVTGLQVALDAKLESTATAANSNTLGGMGASSTATTANTIPARDSNGDVYARLFRSTYVSGSPAVTSLVGRVSADGTGDNYLRPITIAGVKSALAMTIADVSGLQAAINGKAASAHTHAAGDIVSGTLADARLPTKGVALGLQYPLLQSLDAQGRVTGYTIAVNLAQLEGLGSAVGQVPYISNYSIPNVTWGTLATTATGRALMAAANAAAGRSAIGAVALAGDTMTGDLVANGTNGIDVRAGISGGYGTSNGSGGDWGANIWGMGNAYDGAGLGTSYSVAGHYGISWLRVSHASANPVAGEGLYVAQGGTIRAAVGSAGIWSAGSIAAASNLAAGAFAASGATNGFLAGATGMYSSRSTTAAAYHLSIYNPNGNVGGITTSGTATTFATSSDHRRKFDVEPLVEFELTPEQFGELPNALLRVMLLQPSSYRRVEEEDGPLHHGFIAHELQAVMPHAVVGDKDAVDGDGNQILQLVDHSKLVTDTVAGLQGLTIMVLDHFAALTAANDDRFAAIENRLDQLEAA